VRFMRRVRLLSYRPYPLRFAAAVAASVLLLLTTGRLLRAAPDPAVQPVYAKLPLSFEENRGQAPADVSYLSRTRSGVLLLRPGSFSLDVDGGQTISVRFVGTAGPSVPTGEQKLIGTTSYLIGDEADWVRAVPNYASVRYASVYPGIDAVFHGNREHLEYDFVLRPGADPAQIRIAFEGADRVVIAAEGNLELSAPHGTMKHLKPRIWQDGPHGREEVAGRYVLSGAAEARFEVDEYDRRGTLVIDPVIEYSTYFGSPNDDRARAVATDSTGATYIAGSTATGGVSWGFVSKVNPGGTAVVYTVFFGNDVCDAAARGIDVDSLNNAIVTGFYVQQDAAGACNVKQVYGAKINSAGNTFVYQLVWGGDQDYGTAVAVDGPGNAYFTGSTNGDFPTTAGVIFPSGWLTKDAFITKLSPTGGVIYSTYLGGSLSDEGLAIAVDTNGNAHVSGSTSSGDWPTTAGAVQPTMPNLDEAGFVTKVNGTATQILYSTFLGGSSRERVDGIAVDALRKIHVTGNTGSTDFPTTANAWDSTCGVDGACNTEDVFYSKIDPLKTGAAGLIYSTFLGGASRDFGEAIAIDQNGRAWITGRTASGDFPKVGATQGTFGGNYDAFVAQIDPALSSAASLRFSSFLGGALYDEATGLKVDPPGDIHVVGYTASTNFPVAGALQPQTAGGNEGFIVKIVSPALVALTLNPGTVTGGANSTGTVTLSAAAPAGGAVVTLTSSRTNVATVPASVTVAAGATTATFAITSNAVTAGTVATITATYDGISRADGLVVNPLLGSLTLNPVVLTGGTGSTGTVTLTAPAPAAGTVVTLTSANANAATVPASVTVATGATSATFPVSTSAVTAVTSVNITATCAGASRIVTLTVNPPAGLAGVTVNPATVTGAAGSTGTVTLGTAAPAGGAVVTLASNNINAATVPAAVTVPANATTATFAIATNAVTAATAVTITATYSGVAKTATLTVNPPTAGLAGVSLNPAAVTGGANSTGTVTLGTAAPAGGVVVTLASSNINAATVPAAVTVPANATTATFAIATKVVIAVKAVTIKATSSGVIKKATLTVNPPAAGLADVSVNPAAVTGGANSTGTVTLGAAAPAGGAVVTLASNNLNAATVPAAVTVPANATTATFPIATNAVTAVTAVTITATYNGVAKTATLTVNPAGPAALAGVTMNPATMIFGSMSTGTVTLTSAAPAGGAVVSLSSSEWVSFVLPASVTVPAGATSAQFPVTTAIGQATTIITASYNGVNKTAPLTSVYPTVAGLTCTPNPVIAGNTTVCTVTMNGIMPAATPVWILSDQPFFAPAPPGTVTVPAGAVSAAFSITTTLVPDQIVAHISANALATATVTAPLTINLTNRGRKWVLNNVVFKDGSTANGYFIYDPVAGQYLAVNILVTPGPDQNNPMGHPPQNLYYYPWPNGFKPTIVDDWSTASLMSLQNPVTVTPPSWTLLQFNFAQPLTNAGGTIPLVINPNVPYTPYCAHNPSPTCTPPPGNISQELFALPDNIWGVVPAWYYRVIVSGTVTAQ
jgi:Beta-propeller repeat